MEKTIQLRKTGWKLEKVYPKTTWMNSPISPKNHIGHKDH